MLPISCILLKNISKTTPPPLFLIIAVLNIWHILPQLVLFWWKNPFFPTKKNIEKVISSGAGVIGVVGVASGGEGPPAVSLCQELLDFKQFLLLRRSHRWRWRCHWCHWCRWSWRWMFRNGFLWRSSGPSLPFGYGHLWETFWLTQNFNWQSCVLFRLMFQIWIH